MLSAHRMPSGTEQMMASSVPQTAMCTVTIISVRYDRHSWKSGGKKSAAKVAMFPESRYSASGFISAPCQAQASRIRNRPQPRYCGQVLLPTASACKVVMVILDQHVGAGLLANAVYQPLDSVTDTPHSRASPLPQALAVSG